MEKMQTPQTPLTELRKTEDYRLTSEHFDVNFYLSQLSTDDRPEDPVAHFMTDGITAGLDPNLQFSTLFYLRENPDVAAAGVNPFIHYLKWGKTEGRIPHPDFLENQRSSPVDTPEIALLRQHFDIEFYEAHQPSDRSPPVDAVHQYHYSGWRQGRDPSPYFSTGFYLDVNEDVRESGMDPFYHYLRWGRHEGRRAYESDNPLRHRHKVAAQKRIISHAFDEDHYKSQNPALYGNDADPIQHYLSFGWRSGLDPSFDFSTNFYIKTNSKDYFTGGDPLSDYILEGGARGRVPSPVHECLRTDSAELRFELQKTLIEPYFDEKFYSDCNAHLLEVDVEPIDHYLKTGWKQGRDPAPWFVVDYYCEAYPDACVCGIDPLSHYVIWGRTHGCRPSPATIETGSTTGDWFCRESVVQDKLLTELFPDPYKNRVMDSEIYYNPNQLHIHWIVPNFGIGGGGHMTIFRIIHWLEYFGHRCTIWVKGLAPEQVDTTIERVLKHYQFVKADLRALDETIFATKADVLFATSWDTACTVRDAKGFKSGFYFIQDYEPLFSARGSRAIMAEATYEMGLASVCASPWLRSLIETRHDGWARHFYLSYDREFYFPPPSTNRGNKTPRIALYGRIATERRCVELALLALEILSARGVTFHLDIFGSNYDFTGLQCAVTNHGILDPVDLGRLYRDCDLGLCFSGTNYSLVPQEMMGSGLPVIELDVESARGSIPADAAAFSAPDPVAIADTIQYYLQNPDARQEQARRGLAWANQHDWETAAKAVESAIFERLESGKWKLQKPSTPSEITKSPPTASVIVPTLNGGQLYKELLDRLANQKTDFDVEIIIVDSGSEDDTVAATRHLPNTQIIEIDRSSFQHGRTRNLAASHSSGEFLVFLTQDALPADAFWLYNFIHSMMRYPEAAGAFGRHYGHHDASAYTRMEIRNHFARFDQHPLLHHKHLDIVRWNARDRDLHQLLHFYSDNNSCMRRSAWQEMPYPEVDYGEDQLWAMQAIKRGWSKLYCPNAVVYHSHDYDSDETRQRAEVEAWFFATYFGYDLGVSDIASEHAKRVAVAERFGRDHNLPRDVIEQRKRNGLAQLEGWNLGVKRAREHF